MAILVPLLLLGGLEFGLRLSGFGYPTSFFLPTEIAGHRFYVTNGKFGHRFFPASLARTPLIMRLADPKPANSYRIFLFGESAAQGDPDPSFGAGRYLEVLLRERYPGTDFQVVCAAMTAINSHALLPIARECAQHDGDLWIVYMGNNEFVGPFGGGTVFGRRAPSRAAIKFALALKTTRTGQLINTLAAKFNPNSTAPKAWSGMNMFKEQRLAYDDPSRLRTYDNFKGNLEDMLDAGRNARVPVLLSTVGSSLKDCAPFSSLHPANLTEKQKSDWDGFYNSGTNAEAAENYGAALDYYEKASRIDPGFAELLFRMGSCQLALTNWPQASHSFEMARDYDALAFRADTRINQTIKDAAARHAADGVHLVDAEQMLAQSSPGGIPGQELFYEHVHLNFAGNYLLARAFAAEIAPLLPAQITAHAKTNWASAEFCDQRLAVSPWDRYRLLQMNLSRVSEPPFTEQLNHAARARAYMAEMKEVQTRLTADSRDSARAMYREDVAAAPDDWLLHGNFSQFLDEVGDLASAVGEQQRVCGLLPCFAAPQDKAGLLLVRERKSGDAAACFLRALALDPDFVPAMNELGEIRANEGKTAEATNYFARALRLNPGYVEAYFNWGFLDQTKGQIDQAMGRYRVAAELQPDGPAAYFSQAVAAAAQRHPEDAINLFQAAVWMYPSFWQARYLLGDQLVATGKISDAQAQFEQVTRIRPDFARGHVNLGVALGKQGQLDDALKEFGIALQLDPADESAQKGFAVTKTLKGRQRQTRSGSN